MLFVIHPLTGLFRCVAALGICCAPLAATLLRAQETSALHGQLERGPHAVGFRSILLRDYTRTPIPVEGLVQPATAGRLVPMHVWYPAEASSARALQLGDYAALLAQNADPAPVDEARRSAAQRRFIASIPELGGDRVLAEREAARILALSGIARRDARPAPGRHPVVLFPEYYAPVSNSVMAEHLASHGFVVASVPMLAWRSAIWPGGSPPNFESYVGDLQFALGALRDLEFADRERIASMGVGISANAVVALQMRTPLIRAHISLDGGLISPTEDATLKRTPFFDATAIRTPMLLIWSPHPNLVPALADQYKYAQRLMLHFPGLTEYRYLNYGPLDALIPGLLGQPRGDTALNLAWAARYVRAFLAAHLRDDPGAHAFLAEEPDRHGAPAALVEHRLAEALPAPPPLDDVRRLMGERGAGAFTALYRNLREKDPEPYSMAQLLELQIWAGGAGRDPDGTLRKEIALVRLEAFPQSARVHYGLANVLAQRGESDAARHHFQETLRLLPGDPDPSLDDSFKNLIRQRVEDALKRLLNP